MAQGKFGGGNGSSSNPYLIEDADDLNAIRNFPSGYFKVVNDINLGKGKYISGQGWNPIQDFTGVLDGNNHNIINLNINRPTEDFVGFFKACYGTIQNCSFVDSEVIGHNYVGTICGYCMAEASWGGSLSNVFVTNGKVTGNNVVGGIGHFALFLGNKTMFNNVFVDVKIKSQDGCAYGIGKGLSRIAYKLQGKIRNSQCYGYDRRNTWNGFLANCVYNCNCWDCGTPDPASWNYSMVCVHCSTKIHKDPSVTVYYALFDVHGSYSACYADNFEQSPIVASGIEYKNLSNIDYSTNILPNVDANLLKTEWKSKVEPLNLNKNSIYFKTDKGYAIYDFVANEWEIKYIRFTDENSIKIIQNGMNKADLAKIPVAKLKELQDENNKVKIVNCINAHEKIVSKTEIIETNKFKEYLDKNIFRKKIKFDKYNDKIMNVIRI